MSGFVVSGQRYLNQLAKAAQSEREFVRRMQEDGWKFNSLLNQWTHPDKPGIVVEK